MVTKLETQGKQIFQWGEKFVDIATLEKAVYEAVLSLGRNIMRQCIEEADRTLARQRDRGMYRDKGYRPTTLKTVMGEVGYQRHVYLLSGAAEQPRATVYLLDRSMGLDTVGLFSDTVCMMAVEAACAVSHRTAAATLNDLTGLSLSHESVWRIVQNAGSWPEWTAWRRRQRPSVGLGPMKRRYCMRRWTACTLLCKGKTGWNTAPAKR